MWCGRSVAVWLCGGVAVWRCVLMCATQGGGQPSDCGVMIATAEGVAVDGSPDDVSVAADTLCFVVRYPASSTSHVAVCPCVSVFMCPDGGAHRLGLSRQVEHARCAPGTSVVVHYGRFQRSTAAFTCGRDDVASGAFAATTDVFGPGTSVAQHVARAVRMANAKRHSGGHLLDRAMSAIGYSLDAGKGYHFEDGAPAASRLRVFVGS